MEKEELRIGDYIYDDLMYVMKLDSFEKEFDRDGSPVFRYYDESGSENFDIKPIVLTEEILLKCGIIPEKQFMGKF